MSSKHHDYMAIVGALLWLSNVSYFHLAFASSQLARFVANPGEEHFSAASPCAHLCSRSPVDPAVRCGRSMQAVLSRSTLTRIGASNSHLPVRCSSLAVALSRGSPRSSAQCPSRRRSRRSSGRFWRLRKASIFVSSFMIFSSRLMGLRASSRTRRAASTSRSTRCRSRRPSTSSARPRVCVTMWLVSCSCYLFVPGKSNVADILTKAQAVAVFNELMREFESMTAA